MNKLFIPLISFFIVTNSFCMESEAVKFALSQLTSSGTALKMLGVSPLSVSMPIYIPKYQPSPSILYALGGSILAGAGYIQSAIGWGQVAKSAVDVGKKGVALYEKKVDSDIETNKKLTETHEAEKEALMQINGLTLVQLQMLALTEGNNGNTSTYFRDLYKKTAIAQQNKVKEAAEKSSFPRIECQMVTK